jgi:copper(I)-binding protein
MRFSRTLPLVAVFVHISAWSVEITEAWMRAMPPGQPVAAAYVTFRNEDEGSVRLVGASSTLAKTVEIHESRQVDGIWSMRKLSTLELPPGGEIELSPGGVHLMLFGLTTPLREGDQLPLELQLDSGETLKIGVEVRAIDFGGKHSHHHH